jgi:anti-sigma factor RsiW
MSQNSSEQAVPEITCREVAEWTSAYLDEHLDDPFKIRMALHLAVCAGCEAYVRQSAAVRDIVRFLPNEDARPADTDRLRELFSERCPPRTPTNDPTTDQRKESDPGETLG